MVEKTFGATFSKIKDYDLANLGEEAIKQGVILPLLNQAGWATEDITEVCPEFPVAANSGDKVDYSLRIGGTNQVFVEAKAGRKSDLLKEETQVTKYCCAAKPSLAVLTNGSQWRLYLPPQHPRSKAPSLRLFLEFDVTDDSLDPGKFEKDFKRFLARDKVSTPQSVKQTIDDARMLFKEKQNKAAFDKAIDTAIDKATSEKLAEMVALWVEENTGHRPTVEQVKQRLDSQGVKITRDISQLKATKGSRVVKVVTKPASFTFQVEGEKPVTKRLPKSAWSQLLVGVCELMRERHSDTFGRILEIQGFAKSDDGMKSPIPIFRVGLYFPYPGGATGYRQVCAEVLAKFGYPRNCLTVRVKGGMEVPL